MMRSLSIVGGVTTPRFDGGSTVLLGLNRITVEDPDEDIEYSMRIMDDMLVPDLNFVCGMVSCSMSPGISFIIT